MFFSFECSEFENDLMSLKLDIKDTKFSTFSIHFFLKWIKSGPGATQDDFLFRCAHFLKCNHLG